MESARLRAFGVSEYPTRDPAPSHHQDSSLPYSQAPAVSVRLVSTGTMKLLRLPILSPRPPFVGLGGDTLASAKDDVGSPKFPENPSVPMPCSRTPAEPRCLAFAALRCCPPTTEPGGPRRPGGFRCSITRPQHWLFTLRAAIADDDAKLASGGWPLFPGWDSSLPTEFCWEVSAFRPPLPLGFASLGAIRSPSVTPPRLHRTNTRTTRPPQAPGTRQPPLRCRLAKG
jgi:hypothetical protein